MSEATPEVTPDAPAPAAGADAPQEGKQEPQTFDADYVAGLRKEAAKYRTEAKAATAEIEKVRQASMTEAEKAVAEAEARGRSAAASDFGKRLATSEIRATAADAGADLAGVFDYLDLARFVGDDGEPDTKAITAFVDGLPKKETPTPSYDGGTRTPPPAGQSMSGLIRKAAGRA